LTEAELEMLERYKTRYRLGGTGFEERQVEYLIFTKWLYGTGRLYG
jgi:hypothetical protein